MASIEKGPTAVTKGAFKGLAHETKGTASIYHLRGTAGQLAQLFPRPVGKGDLRSDVIQSIQR